MRHGVRLSKRTADALDVEFLLWPPGRGRRVVLERLLDDARSDASAIPILEEFIRDGSKPARGAFEKRGEEAQRPRKADRPRCGARARSRGGAPCVAPVVCRRDSAGKIILAKRCRLHGGLSTGAKTPEGRARCIEAARRRWRRWREERATAQSEGP